MQYFRNALRYHMALRPLFCLFLRHERDRGEYTRDKSGRISLPYSLNGGNIDTDKEILLA